MKNKSIGFKKVLLLFLSCSFLVASGQGGRQERIQQRTRQRSHGQDINRTQTNNAGLNIVCSFSDYASIAQRIAGNKGNVDYIAHGEQDPHFVSPKPSYAMKLHDADLWVTTGLDLEVWSTTILDKARNKQIMDGAPGFVSVSDGVNVLQKVEKAAI